MEGIHIYDKQLKFQEKISSIQQERSKLERQFYIITRNDKKLHSLQNTKLRSYWKQICTRENTARQRNEELIADFSKLNLKILTLQSQTSKLRNMKKEYEEKVSKLYPKWKYEVEVAAAKKQLQNKGFGKLNSPQSTLVSTILTSEKPLQLHPRTPVFTSYIAENAESSLTSQSSQISQNHMVKEGNMEDVHIPSLQLPLYSDNEQLPKAAKSTSIVNKDPISSNSMRKYEQPTPVISNNADNDGSPHSQLKLDTSTPTLYQHYILHLHLTLIIKLMNNNLLDSVTTPSSESDSFNSDIDNASETQTKPTNPNQTKSFEHSLHSELMKQDLPSDHHATKIVIPSPHEPAVCENNESIVSESLTTETSPRTDAPLTSSSAYQALLKGHGLNLSSTLGEGGFVEDDNDVENLLSPVGTSRLNRSSDESDEYISEPDLNPSKVEPSLPTLPTIPQEDKLQHQTQKKIIPKKKPKAPWDTESESEEHNSIDHPSDNDDDFDFYD
ncbi:LOW QUALITY PROTEIN: uncharacterized protein LOC100185602 [Ciona intestinalis]